MLYELCLELNNFFEYAVYIGEVTIENGNPQTDLLQENQYFRIVGSVFNDGVYKYPQDPAKSELVDEVYHGGLWAMAVPKEVIALADEIKAWNDKYAGSGSVAMSPYQSESFGGYSYTKASGSTDDSTSGANWQNAFKNRLNQWRKLK